MPATDSSEPAHLIALAAELEREGQYNVAKLLRAASDSLITRRSFTVRPPREVPEQVAELRKISLELAGTAAVALAQPLLKAATAMEENRVPFSKETPDPRVCRICGLAASADFEDRCPHCGAWPSTVRKARAIYWLTESGPIGALNLLRSAPKTIAGLIGDRDDATLATSRQEGDWSAHQVIEHLHFAQTLMRGRLDLLLAGGEPELASAEVWKMEGRDAGTRALFDAYHALRSEIIDILERAPAESWWNVGLHEEWGRVTLLEQASYFANHEPTHLAQLADSLA